MSDENPYQSPTPLERIEKIVNRPDPGEQKTIIVLILLNLGALIGIPIIVAAVATVVSLFQ